MIQNNNPNDYLEEDVIDLKEIFKILINSKKLIIVITLIITTLGSIYSFQKVPQFRSTALIEIGNSGIDEYEQITIEPAKNLIKELTINFIHKQKILNNNTANLKIKSIQDRLIQISHSSASSEQSEYILSEVIGYIENRHALLLNESIQKTKTELAYKIENINNQIKIKNSALSTQRDDEKLRLSNQIESLKDQIKMTNSTLLIQNNGEKLRLSNQIESLKDQIKLTNSSLLTKRNGEITRISNEIFILNNILPTLDRRIKVLNNVIVEDQNNLKLLASDPDLLIQRAAQSPSLSQVISSYKDKLIDYENEIVSLKQKKNTLGSELKALKNTDLESSNENLNKIYLEIFKLSQVKESLEFELRIIESNTIESDEILKLSEVKDKLGSLELELKLLKSNNLESSEIFKLSQVKEGLEFESEFLLLQNPIKTQLVGEIDTSPIDPKKERIIFLSFIIGFFLSMVIVFINHSLKALKEE